MADTKPIKSLPVRVQFTLNPVAHPDAIKLLSSLAQSDLAGAVADLVQWGAMLKCSMAQGQFAILTNLAQIQAAASLAGQPVQRRQALHRPQRKPTSISCLHRG